MNGRNSVVAALASVVPFAVVAAAQAATFTGVGFLDPSGTYKYSRIFAISPDGTIAVGDSKNSAGHLEAFMYNITTGVKTGLGFPPDADPNYSTAVGVGITSTGVIKIAVNCKVTLGGTYDQAYIWSSDLNGGAGGYTDDFILIPGGFNSTATALTVQLDDEVMVSGIADDAGLNVQGFRYRDGKGVPEQRSMLSLGKPPTSAYPNYAYGVSVFGDCGGYDMNCQLGGGNHRACWSWEPIGNGVYTWLDTLEGPPRNDNEAWTRARLSLDGLHVVGISSSTVVSTPNGPDYPAFRQVSPTAVESLGVLAGQTPAHYWAEAYATNAYGNVVVGYSMENPNSSRRFFWWTTATGGMQEFSTVIGGMPAGWTLGIPFHDWNDYDIAAISQSGSTVGGWSPHNGNCEGWIVQGLPVPPAPPPAIAQPPNDTQWIAGNPYTKNLSLTAGRLPLPGWSITGPSGIGIAPDGKGAVVSGWTPLAADVGTTVTLQATATSATGSDTRSWTVTVVKPPAPRIQAQLLAGATTIAVDRILSYATEVAVYKNGVKTYTKTFPGTETPAGVTFDSSDGVTPLVLNDYYEVTQTTGGAESNKSYPWRMVLPTTLSFADGFETGAGGPGTWPKWWLRSEQTISTAQPHAGSYSVFEDVTSATQSNGNNFADLTATRPDDSYYYPVVMEFWMYETVRPGVGSRHRCGLYQYSFGGWEPGIAGGATGLQWILELGTFPGNDNTKYQCRVVKNGTGGPGASTPAGAYPNLADPLAPARTTGWHKFSIVAGDNMAWWYVDGRRGLKLNDVSTRSLNAVRVGNETGSPDYDAGIPGSGDAYYDDVSVFIMHQHEPTLTLTNIVGSVGQAITPTNEIASDVDTPDTLALQVTGTLPAGLTATLNGVPVTLPMAAPQEFPASISAGPVATLAISGTPASGSEGVYTLDFTATDDLVKAWRGTATGSMTITIAAGCNTPPQDTDGDGDVDLGDFSAFAACFNGPNRPWPGSPIPDKDCRCVDGDGDMDVDLEDFARFTACFNGPNRRPACLP